MTAEREAATAAATMMPFSLRQEYLDIPVVTRVYMTACILTTAAVELGLVSPFQLYFSPDHLVGRYQIWRMFTNFLYFGPLGLNFVLNMIFLYRYCRMLEEGSFRGRRADFVFMLWFTGLVMMLFSLCSNIPFLGQSFIIMLVYVWSRRNTQVRMNFFGLLNFRAPYLPCVLTGFSLLLGNSILIDVLGICVGHMYYYIEDVFPNQPEGWKLLITPDFLRALLDQPEDQEDQQQDEEQRQDGQQQDEEQRQDGQQQDEEQRQDDELNH